jgi:hypothetical protein
MKKIAKINSIIPLLAVLISLSACNLPPVEGEKAALVITMPGAITGARGIKPPEDMNNDFSFRLKFTGPGRTQDVKAGAGETITVYLEPGTWKVDITAYLTKQKNEDLIPPVLAGKKTETITVYAGRDNRMNAALSLDENFLVPVENVNKCHIGAWKNNYSVNNRYTLLEPYFYITPENIKYQWYYWDNQRWVKHGTASQIEAGDPSWDIPLILNDMYNYYYCEVTYTFDETLGEEGGIIVEYPRKYTEFDTTINASDRKKENSIAFYSSNAGGLKDWIKDAGSVKENSIYFEDFTNGITIDNAIESIEITEEVTLVVNHLTLRKNSLFREAIFSVKENGKLTLMGLDG